MAHLVYEHLQSKGLNLWAGTGANVGQLLDPDLPVDL